MIKINNRLQQISDFLYPEDKVIDIGCDHGLLGIYLTINKKIYVVDSDINELPLNNAKENNKKYNVNIETRLGNGLETITKEINTIVISGMGTDTIIDILKDIEKYPNIKKIVLSPNTDFYKLRKYMNKTRYRIKEEQIVLENKKYYLVVSYIKENKRKNNPYFGKLDLNNNINKSYYQNIINKNKKIIPNLKKHYILKNKLLLINKIIEKRLNNK